MEKLSSVEAHFVMIQLDRWAETCPFHIDEKALYIVQMQLADYADYIDIPDVKRELP